MYLLQFFKYEHLPPHLQEVSKPFAELAEKLVKDLPSNPESTTALRKLLEAKDCAVRAKLFDTEIPRSQKRKIFLEKHWNICREHFMSVLYRNHTYKDGMKIIELARSELSYSSKTLARDIHESLYKDFLEITDLKYRKNNNNRFL